MKDAFKLHKWNWRTLEARLIIVLTVITSAKEVLFSLSLLVVGLMGGWNQVLGCWLGWVIFLVLDQT